MNNEINTSELTPEETFPKEEMWTYQIEGLAAPNIGRAYKNYTLKKVILAVVIVAAVSLSIFFSVQIVNREAFEYQPLENGTVELIRFGNPVNCSELTIDYYTEIEYKNSDNNDAYEFIKDKSRPVSIIHEYAFNCDEKIQVINIGADVEQIDGKSFYTCKNLQAIYVDEKNEHFCDIDGVLYTKDLSTVICYPIAHDVLLREKTGYKEEVQPEDKNYNEYRKDVLTYVLPSQTQTIGKLCFNYSKVKDIYLPEGLKRIETLAFFKTYTLAKIYSYKGTGNTLTNADAVKNMEEIYNSLPEGLAFIGSDAFAYNYDMDYMFIPESVTEIGHHAFWETAYKENGEIKGVSIMHVALDEESFDKQVKAGDQWKSQYDNGAFRKTVSTQYGASRQAIK